MRIDGRYCCAVCGVEDDETWWADDGLTYVGPAEAVFCDMREPGRLLRRPGDPDRTDACS